MKRGSRPRTLGMDERLLVRQTPIHATDSGYFDYALRRFEPKRAHVAAPGGGANNRTTMLRHGIEAGPNVLPALVGVHFGALLGLFDDWTAMAFVVIDGQSVLGLNQLAISCACA